MCCRGLQRLYAQVHMHYINCTTHRLRSKAAESPCLPLPRHTRPLCPSTCAVHPFFSQCVHVHTHATRSTIMYTYMRHVAPYRSCNALVSQQNCRETLCLQRYGQPMRPIVCATYPVLQHECLHARAYMHHTNRIQHRPRSKAAAKGQCLPNSMFYAAIVAKHTLCVSNLAACALVRLSAHAPHRLYNAATSQQSCSKETVPCQFQWFTRLL